MSATIIPIKGHHESVKSLLAEVMSDDEIKHIIIFAFTEDGHCKQAHQDATVEQFSFVAVSAFKTAMDNLEDEG